MNVFLSSVSLIGIAEIGDKTQLLSIILAARYRSFWPIFFGVLLATIFNHAGSAYTGKFLAEYISADVINYITAAIFIGLGLWILIPDEAPEEIEAISKRGAFMASFVALFIAEMGDKTQFATITLGAQYADTVMVTLGTTVGMMLANVPAIIFGERIMNLIPIRYVHITASVLFIGFGVYSLCMTLL